MAQSRLARDRELRAMAPPMDWEAIASEGAERLALEWNSTKGKGLPLGIPEAREIILTCKAYGCFFLSA